MTLSGLLTIPGVWSSFTSLCAQAVLPPWRSPSCRPGRRCRTTTSRRERLRLEACWNLGNATMENSIQMLADGRMDRHGDVPERVQNLLDTDTAPVCIPASRAAGIGEEDFVDRTVLEWVCCGVRALLRPSKVPARWRPRVFWRNLGVRRDTRQLT